jgi:plastocyanin
MGNVAPCVTVLWLLLLAGALDAAAGEAARVVISDLEYGPSTVTISVGDTVTWLNRDIVEHTVTARDGAFDIATPKGRPVRWRATRSGEFAYSCRLHPNMAGLVRVVR